MSLPLILSLLLCDRKPHFAILGIIQLLIAIFPEPMDHRNFRCIPQFISGGRKPLRHHLPAQSVDETGWIFAPFGFTDQILSCRNIQMLKPACHLPQIVIEILQCILRKQMSKIEIISIRTKIGQNLIGIYMISGHPLQDILIYPIFAGKIVILHSLVVGIPRKPLFISGQEYCWLFFDSVVHNTTTFQRNFDRQAGKGFQFCTAAARLRRCDTVEPMEGLCKALRRVIAIFESNINYLFVAAGKFHPGKGQPPAANVLPQRIATKNAEHPLEMKGRRKALFRDNLIIQLLCNVIYFIPPVDIDSSK